MRRILIEKARHRKRLKWGGGLERLDLDPAVLSQEGPEEDVLALDEALAQLAAVDWPKAQLVKLRYFVGLTIPECAAVLGISPRTADAWWSAARAQLRLTLE
jgi:DNA-directed RNA polymerase specialized sigma24 family protein